MVFNIKIVWLRFRKKKKLTPYQIRWIDDRIHGSGGHRTNYLDFFDSIKKKEMIK